MLSPDSSSRARELELRRQDRDTTPDESAAAPSTISVPVGPPRSPNRGAEVAARDSSPPTSEVTLPPPTLFSPATPHASLAADLADLRNQVAFLTSLVISRSVQAVSQPPTSSRPQSSPASAGPASSVAGETP